MSKLSAIHKQIAALQAEAERITKQEMSAAIAKVKGLMSEFGLTIEHLTQSVVGKPAAKKAKATKAKATKAKTASVAKYADPKTGKTWSGFGRAPAWIAGAKSRDEFLVGAVKAGKPAAAKKKVATKSAAPAKKSVKVKASAVAKPAAKKATASKAVAKKKAATKAAAPKKIVTPKAVGKKAAPRKVAASSNAHSPLEAAPTAA